MLDSDFQRLVFMLRNSIFFASLALFSAPAQSEEIKMWISTSVEANIMSKVREPFEKKTGIKIVTAGDNKGVSGPTYYKDVVTGKAEASANSGAYEDWVSEAKKKGGVTDADVAEITYRVIGHDVMLVFCNKDVGVTSLTLDQVKGLFVGSIKNWKEVGGADVPMKIIFPASVKVSSFGTFKKLLLKDKEFGAPVTDVKDYAEMIKVIGQTPGACGFGATGLNTEGTLTMKTPALGRPSILITKGRPSAKVQKLIDFIRSEGSKLGVH